jgi:type II secretory pathway pseudopilin PulG
MIELVVVTLVLLVAASIFSQTIVATARQRAINRENAKVAEAAKVVFELMRNEPFELVYALFNGDPEDDPDGPGTGPGNRFEVAGLDAHPDSSDGWVGEILFPTVVDASSGIPVWELREDVVDRGLGTPRDLNGDNFVDSEDHADDYLLLPVRVELRWSGKSGAREFELCTMLTTFRR